MRMSIYVLIAGIEVVVVSAAECPCTWLDSHSER